MARTAAASLHEKRREWYGRLKQLAGRMERLPAERSFETIASIMYWMILLFGVPYFLFTLWSFVRLNG
ncbi:MULTISPECIES: hypothetical protein [unclassified Sporolactobacillus]|uniref:hypothetical protein n=1 Tax=unclassified Sporolactobacillus TaxID=2628533 RepID=UPI0023683C0E|nr:hypothetical protein [Sporolactobacillus sp. CQH2019]MDD9148738.1 hypothetical protein [Sporolactobacillus sp. CQH2019]